MMEAEVINAIANMGIGIAMAIIFTYVLVKVVFPAQQRTFDTLIAENDQNRKAFLAGMESNSNGVKSLCDGQREVCSKLEDIKGDTDTIIKKLGANHE